MSFFHFCSTQHRASHHVFQPYFSSKKRRPHTDRLRACTNWWLSFFSLEVCVQICLLAVPVGGLERFSLAALLVIPMSRRTSILTHFVTIYSSQGSRCWKVSSGVLGLDAIGRPPSCKLSSLVQFSVTRLADIPTAWNHGTAHPSPSSELPSACTWKIVG